MTARAAFSRAPMWSMLLFLCSSLRDPVGGSGGLQVAPVTVAMTLAEQV